MHESVRASGSCEMSGACARTRHRAPRHQPQGWRADAATALQNRGLRTGRRSKSSAVEPACHARRTSRARAIDGRPLPSRGRPPASPRCVPSCSSSGVDDGAGLLEPQAAVPRCWDVRVHRRYRPAEAAALAASVRTGVAAGLRMPRRFGSRTARTRSGQNDAVSGQDAVPRLRVTLSPGTLLRFGRPPS